jgi:pathogenesis-related protein 1
MGPASQRHSARHLRARSHAARLALALLSACTAGSIGDVDDRPPPGAFGTLDASATLDGGAPPQGGGQGGGSAWPASPDAAGVDAAPPSVGMDAATPRDAGVPDVSVPRDVGTTPMMEAGGGGANPEPGRLAGITAAHNAVRAMVDTDTPLPPLEWSADIHAVAQAYAEKLAASCSNTLTHSSMQERNGWGENLAMTGGQSGSAQQAVALWESEIECYTFGPFQGGVNATCSSACSDYGGCGHYTQMVWRKSRRVGCGVAECGSGARIRVYWVCNYDPVGNYIGQLPY